MKLFCHMLLIIFSLNSINAQINKTVPEMTLSSPETASLGKYLDIPFSQYTGTSNIDVPLHIIDFEGLKIPISLSYNTGGIQVAQEASIVGLGWTTSIEPSISRQIKGQSDLKENPDPNILGYPYTTEPLSEFAYAISDEAKQNIVDALNNYSDPNINAGTNNYDTEPDIFSVNIFGENAKFILTQKALNNGTIGVKLLNPESKLKILYNESTLTFTVFNSNGFQFNFDIKELALTAAGQSHISDLEPIMLGSNDFVKVIPDYNYPFITGWRVSQITSPKNNIITYHYSSNYFIDDQPVLWNREKRISCAFSSPDFLQNSELNWNKDFFASITQHRISYLIDITTPKEIITFNLTDRDDLMRGGSAPYYLPLQSLWGGTTKKPRKIQNITIQDKTNQEVRKFDFYYTYFNSMHPNVTNNLKPVEYLRLKLDSIYKNNEFYRSFEYINSESLPSKLSKSTDHWGFYNGKLNINRIPNNTVSANCVYDMFSSNQNVAVTKSMRFFGADKDADFDYGKTGLLKKVSYPTGGATEFEYEGNEISMTKYSNLDYFYNLEDRETFINITSIAESSPSSSQIIHLENGMPYPGELTFTCGSNFNNQNNNLSFRKCTVTQTDAQKIALQLINSDTGAIVFSKVFSSDTTCQPTYFCPPIILTNQTDYTESFAVLLNEVPTGNYYFKVRGLKEVSNMYDEDDGASPGTTDYFKPYNFAVNFKLTVPKSYLHEYYSKEVGGSRIKAINNYSENSISTRKEFKYIESKQLLNGSNMFSSSGLLMNGLVYNDIEDQTDWVVNQLMGVPSPNGGSWCENTVGGYGDVRIVMFNSTSTLTPTPNIFGSHIGYSRVEELDIDIDTHQQKGKIVYYFDNKISKYLKSPSLGGQAVGLWNDEYTWVSEIYHRNSIQSFEERNGKLIKSEVFDKGGRLLKKTEHEYMYQNYFPQRTIGAGGYTINDKVSIFNCNLYYIRTMYNAFVYLPYGIKDLSNPITKTTDTEYFNDEINQIKTFTYTQKYNLREISETNSLGQIKKTINYYPGDEEVAISPYVGDLISKNIISNPLKSESYSGGELCEKTEIQYSIFNTTLLAESKIKSGKGNVILEDLFIYEHYDSKGNVAQYKRLGGITIVVIWGYGGTMPLAKIENATYAQVLAALGTTEAALQSLTVAPANIRTLLPNAMITTYTYKPLVGVSTITDPKGDTVYYDYDGQGRLKSVKDNFGKIISENTYNYRPN